MPQRFRARIHQDDKSSGCAVELPFNPKDMFGKVRTPVRATLRTYTYHTTTCSMRGRYWIPLARQHREAAGVEPGDSVMVTLEADDVPRTIDPPAELKAAFRTNNEARTAWETLSYTHQREHADAINQARRPETRARRVKKTIETLTGTPLSGDKVAGVSDAAVKKATGKTWKQWFTLLDRLKASEMDHKSIALLLRETCNIPHWWSQQVTVGYEQERLGRKKHEKSGGFEVSVSRTINVPIRSLYKAWSARRSRQAWLPEADFTVRKATKEKSMRITWVDDVTHVDAYFYDKGDQKSQVVVQHKKLKPSQTDEMKTLWKERLAALKTTLEG